MQGAAGADLEASERRIDKRWNVFEVALLSGQAGARACVIANLSATGALVSAELELAMGAEVVFEVEDIGPLPATVVHRRGSLIGLKFELDRIDNAEIHAWLAEVEKDGAA